MHIELPKRLDDRLISLAVIGHGQFPMGIRSALEMITGDSRNITYLCFEDGDDPDVFGAQIQSIAGQAPCGCLVLIDLVGGTPCNQLLLHLPEAHCRAVAGVNLAMALEAASAREYASLEELAQIAVEAGGIGILDVYRKRSEKKNG